MQKQRFGGIERLYEAQGLDALSQAHFTVVGGGGVGTWVAEGFARSGVGTITLIDIDDICITNTNLQAHAMQNTIGQAKVSAMAQRIKLINPECFVHEIEDFVIAKNVPEYLNSSMDFVIDATDSIPAKAAMIAYCKRNKINIIPTGGAGCPIHPRFSPSCDPSHPIHAPFSPPLLPSPLPPFLLVTPTYSLTPRPQTNTSPYSTHH